MVWLCWPVARWLNGHLGPHDTVLITLREINYLIDPPTFLAMPNYEAVIPLPPGPDAAQNLARLRDQGITHLVVNGVTPGQAADGDMARLAGPLLNAGCLRQIGAVATPGLLRSRTLGLRAEGEALHYVYAVGGPDCRLP